jgi:hypothetical protein
VKPERVNAPITRDELHANAALREEAKRAERAAEEKTRTKQKPASLA